MKRTPQGLPARQTFDKHIHVLNVSAGHDRLWPSGVTWTLPVCETGGSLRQTNGSQKWHG